jgi:hypothetical protein
MLFAVQRDFEILIEIGGISTLQRSMLPIRHIFNNS